MKQRKYQRGKGLWQRTSLCSRSHYLPLASASFSSKWRKVGWCWWHKLKSVFTVDICTWVYWSWLIIIGYNLHVNTYCLYNLRIEYLYFFGWYFFWFEESKETQKSAVHQFVNADISIKNQVGFFDIGIL